MTPELFVGLVAAHYFGSLFFHSLFLHRYGTHGQFTLTKGWERVFFILTYIFQGPSFLNPRTYAILHLEHHAHSDGPLDPHSPLNFSTSTVGADVFAALPQMMIATHHIFNEIKSGASTLLDLYKDRRFVRWGEFETFASGSTSAYIIGACIGVTYFLLVPVWWCWLFLPLTILNGATQGAIVNWCGHMWGYRNVDLPDNSKNTWVFGTLMLGELFQNNHHVEPENPNFGRRWFEWDPVYWAILALDAVGVLKMREA
jgi:stearoyl-CoA desaturase (delta-9 desaturase)